MGKRRINGKNEDLWEKGGLMEGRIFSVLNSPTAHDMQWGGDKIF